jgi:hypothetical protein
MANRQARGVPTPEFEGQGVATAQMPGVPAESGAAAYAAAEKSVAHLTSYLNTWADKATVSEATRAGTAAALDSGDNLVLRRDGTLAGEAFDKAAIDVYGNRLDASLRADIFDTANAHKADPEAMKGAIDKLGERYLAKESDPDIRAALTKKIADYRFPYEKGAVRERDTALRAEAADATLTAIDTARRDAVRTAFTLGGDPEGDKKLAAESLRIKRLVINGQEAGYIKPAAATRLLESIDNDIAVQQVLGTFSRLETPEARAAFVKNLEADYSAGKALKTLPAGDYQRLTNEFARAIRQDDSQRRQGEREISDSVKSIRARALDGYGVTADEWSGLERVAQRSHSPDMQAAITAARTQATQIDSWWAMKPAELQAQIAAEERKLGATSKPGDRERVKDMRTVFNAMQKQADDDLLGLAERTGRIAPTALSVDVIDNPDLAGPALAKRKAAAEQAAESFGVKPQYFMGHEADQWAALFNAGGDRALGAARLLSERWGPAAAQAAIRQVAPKAGLMAQAADIVASGGSEAYARDVARSLEQRGMEKYKPVEVKVADLKSLTAETYGTAFSHLRADVQDSAVAGARAAFDTRVRLQGIATDISTGKGRETMSRALQEAAGATFRDGVQFGGVGDFSRGWFAGSYKVPVPAGIRADSFREVVGAITDADLKAMKNPPVAASGTPYTVRDIRAGRLIAVDGGYRVALGDDLVNDPRYLRGADGNPFVLDIGSLRDTLRQRVPGAFR